MKVPGKPTRNIKGRKIPYKNRATMGSIVSRMADTKNSLNKKIGNLTIKNIVSIKIRLL